MSVTVSVVIPTYNAARYVVRAVESVVAQTLADVEVIVVDDGSQDETPELLARFGPPVRYLRQDNRGVAAARNLGIEQSRGRYVAFLDADDLWLPEKLAVQLQALRARPQARASATALAIVDADLRPLRTHRIRPLLPGLEDLLFRGNVVGSPSSVVCERTLLEEIGGFDQRFSQCADWDLWIRISARTQFACVDTPLVLYRVHGASMSRSVTLLERDSVAVLEQAFGGEFVPERLRRVRHRADAHNAMVLAGSYYHAGAYRDAARCAATAVVTDWRRIGRLLAYPVRALFPARGHGR